LARKFPLPIKLFYKLFRVYRMKIGIIGVNFKSADLFFREKLALSLQVSSPLFSALNHSKVILSTCNRFEIYFFSENLTETHSELLQKFRAEFESDCGFKLYSYFGQDCFSHLCRVTAGLDSAVLVETEIQGQVKRAYLKAQETPLAKELHFIFQKSLKIGKSIRSQIFLKPGAPNLVNTLSNLLKSLLDCNSKPKLLFVGTSQINTQVIQQTNLNLFDVTICSRSLDRGKKFSEKLGICFISWEELYSWKNYDGVIFASSYPNYIIEKKESQVNQEKLILDLSVPRNVHPQLAENPLIQLLNIDQLNKLIRRYRRIKGEELIDATSQIQTAVLRQCRIFMDKTRYIEKTRSIV